MNIIPLTCLPAAGGQIKFMAVIRADYISITAPAKTEVGARMRTLILDHIHFPICFDRAKSFPGNVNALNKIVPVKDIRWKEPDPLHIICVTAVSQSVLITAEYAKLSIFAS